MLSQCAQRENRSEAEINGQPPGVAVLGQVGEGLEGLLEGGHRLAERGAIVGPGAGLLAVGHGLGPHLAAQCWSRHLGAHRPGHLSRLLPQPPF